jgi:hypothetical protein
LDQHVPVIPAFSGEDHSVRATGGLVEGETLQDTHRPMPAGGAIDDRLNLLLHLGKFV